MNPQTEKCVIVIDADLPQGIIANTAAILGAALARKFPQLNGGDVMDANAHAHLGITQYPIPILKSNEDRLCKLRLELYKHEYEDCIVVDFTNCAQQSRTYLEYTEDIKKINSDSLTYLGIAMYGDASKVKRLTGSLPLLK